MAERVDDKAMISERVAPVLVTRTLGPFDLVVIFVAIVLFINNSAGVQFAGPSVFIFWILAFATFLVTGAFVTAQLGRMFPEEGSLYVWTHKVLGPFWGSSPASWRGGRPDLAGVHRDPVRELPPAVRRAGKARLRVPCIFTENWHVGVVVLAVIWFSALMSVSEDARHAKLRERAVLVLRGGDLPDQVRRRVVALQGNRSSTDFGARWNPFQGDEARARRLPANLVLLVRDPRAPGESRRR